MRNNVVTYCAVELQHVLRNGCNGRAQPVFGNGGHLHAVNFDGPSVIKKAQNGEKKCCFPAATSSKYSGLLSRSEIRIYCFESRVLIRRAVRVSRTSKARLLFFTLDLLIFHSDVLNPYSSPTWPIIR